MSGTAHSAWGLWTTWRRGPDLVDHVAEVVSARTGSTATVRVLYRDDEEVATSGKPLADQTTGQGLKNFDAILIESGADALRVRVAFAARPTEVLVGADAPRRARLRAGVMLEVTSSDPGRRADVTATRKDIADAIERGRPRWVTREAKHGQAFRSEAPGDRGEPGSASRLLERNIRGWPKTSAFPVLFVLVALVLYAGLIVLAVHTPTIYPGETLRWNLTKVKWVVALLGGAVAVAAPVAQRQLFPSVEVATVTNLRRSWRAAASSATIPVVLGLATQIFGLGGLFQ